LYGYHPYRNSGSTEVGYFWLAYRPNRESQHYQSRFLSGYKQYVVGKNISSVNLTNVSGSSLTPIGFDNALTQIKAQAKV